MQKIETAVGEADAQPVLAPIGKPFVEHRPVEDDLVLGRERRRRQNAMAQFGERHGRRAAFADDDGGRGIGGAHGELVRRLHRQQHRHHGRDRVAGAGDVAHLDRIGGNVDRRLPFDVQAHPFFAAGDQHRLAVDPMRELGCGGRDLGVSRDRPMHRGGKFLGIRRDQRRAAINAVIVALRIDDDRLAEAPRRIDDGADDALGEHDPWHSRTAPRRRPSASPLRQRR